MADPNRTIPIIVLAGQSNANSPAIGMSIFDQVRADDGLFVHVAVSGSSLGPTPIAGKGDWNPFGGEDDGANLKSLIAQISAMLDPTSPSYVPGAYLEKVVWIQGEADSLSTSLATNYEKNLNALRTTLTDTFGAHEMVICALSDAAIDGVTASDTRRANYAAVQAAQLALGATDPDVFIVDPDEVAAQYGFTPSTMLIGDMVHYNIRSGFATTLGRALVQAGHPGGNLAAPSPDNGVVHYVTGTWMNDNLTMTATGIGQAYGSSGTDKITLTDCRDGVVVLAGGLDAVVVTANGGPAFHLDLVAIEQLVLTNGSDQVTMAAGLGLVDTGRGNDQVTGRLLDDMILLGNGRDLADGGAGNDTIWGDNGRDILRGGDGNDLLSGGNNRDQLFGGAGADTLTGGGFNDLLTGGTGADVFVITPASGTDRITDFEPGIDRIDLQSPPQSLTFTAVSGSTVVSAGDLTVLIMGLDPSLITAVDFCFV
jgi:Ca2+-binding RTX toxin-like protein